MDNLEPATADTPPQQEGKKENSIRLEKIIRGYTRFQIVLAILLLIPVIFDVMTHGMVVFSTIATIFLGPLFVISIIFEIITALFIKVIDKFSANKTQNNTPSTSTVHNAEASSPEQQIKQTENLKKQFITLFSLLTVIIVLSVSNYLLPQYFVISEAFSQEVTTLNNSNYRATIIKNNPLNGIMTVQLDDYVTFDYICKVYPFGLDSGYGPFCSYEFPDGSNSIGEYIFQKNYNYIQKLLIKYQDTLIVDNAKNIFAVKDQNKMELFFSDLMQNTDFRKSFKAYNDSNDASFSDSLDYMYIRNVQYRGTLYSGIGLFNWANYMEFEP